MTSASPETQPKKKKKAGKIIAGIILAIVLLLGIGGCAYYNSVTKAWDEGTAKFEETETESVFPAEDGTITKAAPAVTESEGGSDKTAEATESTNSDDAMEEFRTALSTALEKEIGSSAYSGKLENSQGIDNKTDADKNGDGILDTKADGAVTARPTETGSTDILLLGSDSRAGTAEAASVSGQRADSIMILHIPSGGGDPYLISIMRDTWVNIPGYGSAKINAALNYGGVALQISTIEQLLGIRIDHVAEIDFTGFKSLTDALGGVTVQVPLSFSTDNYTFTAGSQTMNGSEALAFVRQRYAFADGDYQRVRNQRAFMNGVLATIKSKGAFSNATNLKNIIDSIAPYVTVDSGLTASEMISIAAPYMTSGGPTMHMLTLPNAGTGWSMDGQSIVVLDSTATSALSNALLTNSMGSYVSVYGQD